MIYRVFSGGELVRNFAGARVSLPVRADARDVIGRCDHVLRRLRRVLRVQVRSDVTFKNVEECLLSLLWVAGSTRWSAGARSSSAGV